jgi:hypothetical protein
VDLQTCNENVISPFDPDRWDVYNIWLPRMQLAALEGEQTARFLYPTAGGIMEAHVTRPRGAGPFPLVVLLHGHSIRGRGAEPFSKISTTNLNWLRGGVINKNRNFAPVLMVSGPI